MTYYIGMDVGGTHARIKLVHADGRLLTQAEGQGGTVSSIGYEPMKERFHQLIFSALSACSLRAQDCAGLCLSASGIDSEPLRQQYESILTSAGFDAGVIQAYNDCELLTMLMPPPCIALISGTGSIAMGRQSDASPVIRCGGWSYVISDEGSASNISFQVMRAVLKHWDGQEHCPVLAEAFSALTGIDTPSELVQWCHQNLRNKDVLAQLAPIVEQAAAANDACARRILDKAADQLFELIATLAQRMQPLEGPLSVLLWGSVLMQNHTIRHALSQRIQQAYPLASPQLLKCSALDCAVQLALGSACSAALQPVVS